VQVIRTGYEIEQLRGRLQSLQAERGRLEVELASLNSLEAVEKLAMNELGMVQPGLEQIVVVRSVPQERRDSLVPRDEAADPPKESRLLVWLRRMTKAL
jgi:hypothetical protein